MIFFIEYQLYGFDDLRKTKTVTDSEVQCPINGCDNYVKRQRGHFKKLDSFLCIEHGIYISPSTYHYEKLTDNLVTRERRDYDFLNKVFKVKTESRLRPERSEDAVTWNIFRTLEKETSSVFPVLPRVNEYETIYWGFHNGGVWDGLKNARNHFHEDSFATEPDLVLLSPRDKLFVFVEVKLDSEIKQKFRYEGAGLEKRKKRYSDNDQYNETFLGSFETVAVESRFYELLRQ